MTIQTGTYQHPIGRCHQTYPSLRQIFEGTLHSKKGDQDLSKGHIVKGYKCSFAEPIAPKNERPRCTS